ncbi:MAG: asparagine synthase (glutamine-hydrolyzing) [Wolinella sp.]
MCSICGGNLAYEKIKRASALMAHRGRDFSGTWSDGDFILTHNRLAILELGNSGNQPMVFGDFVLIFNGEIYNYIELKAELERAGEEFFSHSDTEVFLRALVHYGVSRTLEIANGDFAFALYDSCSKRLVLARDRLGNKPLYIYRKNGKLLFASSSSAIAEVLGLGFDEAEVNSNLLFGFGSADKTIYKDVESIVAGTFCEIDLINFDSKVVRYWDLKDRIVPCSLSFERALDEFEELLFDALKLRMRADVDIAMAISGGIDSSLLAALSHKAFPNLRYFGVRFPKFKDACEGEFIDYVGSSLGIQIESVEPEISRIKEDFSSLVRAHGELFRSFSIYAQYCLYKEIGKSCKVALSGQGADELFGGYYHHVSRYIYAHPDEYKNRARLYGTQAEREYDMGRKCALDNLEKLELFMQDNKENAKSLPFACGVSYDGLLERFVPDFDKALLGDILRFSLPLLLRYEDCNAMKFSVENRSPFTDYRVVEFACGLKSEWKFSQGYSKYFLRKLLERHLDSKIAYRLDKRGFSAPEQAFCKLLGISNATPFGIRLAIFEELRRERDLD